MDPTSKLLCEDCANRRDDVKSGILCELTGMKPDYEGSCDRYVNGASMKIRQEKNKHYKAPPVKKEINSLKDIFEALKQEFPGVYITFKKDLINLSSGFFTTLRISQKDNKAKYIIPRPLIFPIIVVLVYLLTHYFVSGLIVSILAMLIYLIVIACLIIYYTNSNRLRNKVRSFLETSKKK